MVTEINHTEASGMLGTTLGLEKGGEGSCFDSSPYSRVTSGHFPLWGCTLYHSDAETSWMISQGIGRDKEKRDTQ